MGPTGGDNAEKGPRRRKGPAPNSSGSGGDTCREATEVTVETLHCVQTDTSPDALQKAVCFSDDHTLLATGGVDGFLRLWEV